MREIGEIIKPRDMEFLIILMVIYMKVNFRMIRQMAKVITITKLARNSKDCGKMT